MQGVVPHTLGVLIHFSLCPRILSVCGTGIVYRGASAPRQPPAALELRGGGSPLDDTHGPVKCLGNSVVNDK
jgi:hypothetical protein